MGQQSPVKVTSDIPKYLAVGESHCWFPEARQKEHHTSGAVKVDWVRQNQPIILTATGCPSTGGIWKGKYRYDSSYFLNSIVFSSFNWLFKCIILCRLQQLILCMNNNALCDCCVFIMVVVTRSFLQYSIHSLPTQPQIQIG